VSAATKDTIPQPMTVDAGLEAILNRLGALSATLSRTLGKLVITDADCPNPTPADNSVVLGKVSNALTIIGVITIIADDIAANIGA
jgi:hypothetical protein